MTTQPRRRATRLRSDTPPPKTGSDERDVLVGFLDYLRTSVAAKVEGVSEPTVRTPGVASGTNLLGLIKHLAHVERYIFLGEDVADWATTFHAGRSETAEGILTAYRDAIDTANQHIAGRADLNGPAHAGTARKNAPSLRWALVHMIEETGRHAGHADILRELIDGARGR
jgi:Protein of unknown function (DUF664)